MSATPLPRRQRERALRRELLLDAAGRVFGRRPYDEATMQEVATEAEIGMQGLYEVFPSKQEASTRASSSRGWSRCAPARRPPSPRRCRRFPSSNS